LTALNSKRVKNAGDDMEYLDKVLGVKVTYEDVEFKHGVTVLDAAYLIPFKAKHGWI